MALSEIAYTVVLGQSIVAWGGLSTLLLLALTFACGFLNKRGNHIIPFKYHGPLAALTLVVALLHGGLALAANMGL
jgi:hypothetical protein